MRVIHRDAALVLSVDIAGSFYRRQAIKRLDGGGQRLGGRGAPGRKEEREKEREEKERRE